LYALGVAAAPWLPKAALLLDGGVTLIWILPTLGLRRGYGEEEEPGDEEPERGRTASARVTHSR
jgi:hypothetical protein